MIEFGSNGMFGLSLEILGLVITSLCCGAGGMLVAMRILPQLARRRFIHSFTFQNAQLIATSPAARRGVTVEDLESDIYQRLTERLDHIFPQFLARLKTAIRQGTRFTLVETLESGPVRVKVACQNDRVEIAVTGLAAPLAHKVLVDHADIQSTQRKLKLLQAAVEQSPVMMWREAPDGKIDWANGAYRTALDMTDQVPAHQDTSLARLFGFSGRTHVKTPHAEERVAPERCQLALIDGSVAEYDVFRCEGDDYGMNYALDAQKAVQAEAALKRFRQTLTQTFATLPVGVAIFDRSRQLIVFNPALSDLTNLAPHWLSTRPTLYDVLNRLRDARMVPERRDFSSWRNRIVDMEASAAKGSYRETWSLASGKTYRVTGQPYPEGAIAFLIEDITSEVSLARKFTQDLKLNQAVFDNIDEAIAVFDTQGALCLSNKAYRRLWNIDSDTSLGRISILDSVRQWRLMCKSGPIWAKIGEFAKIRDDYVDWSAITTQKNGRHLKCRFTPLAGGGTLVRFRDESEIAQPLHQTA